MIGAAVVLLSVVTGLGWRPRPSGHRLCRSKDLPFDPNFKPKGKAEKKAEGEKVSWNSRTRRCLSDPVNSAAKQRDCRARGRRERGQRQRGPCAPADGPEGGDQGGDEDPRVTGGGLCCMGAGLVLATSAQFKAVGTVRHLPRQTRHRNDTVCAFARGAGAYTCHENRLRLLLGTQTWHRAAG